MLRIPQQFYDKKLIFVHVPKNAGTSVSCAIYGETHQHRSARFYQAIDPEFYETTPSFALIREPIDRVISAYLFFRNKGGSHMPLSDLWELKGRHVNSFDDYLHWLDHLVQSKSILDFTMRSQCEFVCGRDQKVLTSHVFRLREDKQKLLRFLLPFGVKELTRMNVSKRSDISISSRQLMIIERIYKADFELFHTCH